LRIDELSEKDIEEFLKNYYMRRKAMKKI